MALKTMITRASLRTTIIVGVILLVITLFVFGRALFARDQFFFGDIGQNHYPARKLITDLEGEGVFPLWNPYLSSGQPLYANPNNLVFHPVSLFFFILPFDAAFKYSIILQYLLCAAGMYLLSRELKLTIHGSILSSLLFTFSGFFLSLGHLYNLLCGAAWIPLFLFLFFRSTRRSLLYVAGAAPVLAVILIGAEPFFIIAVAMLSCGLIFVREDEEGRKFPILRSLVVAASILVAAVLLSSFLLFPAGQMFMNSERGTGLTSEVVSRWSLTPVESLGIVIPCLFGDPLSTSASEYWGSFYFKESLPLFLSLYMGLPALLIAALGFRKSDSRSVIFLILLICAFFLALGSNNILFESFFGKLPFFSSLRYMSKFFIIVPFSLSLLAGIGLDSMARFQDRKKLTAGIITIAVPSCATLALAGIYYAGRFFPTAASAVVEGIFHIPQGIQPRLLAIIRSRLFGNVIHEAGVTLIATFLFIAFVHGRKWKSVISSLFIAVVIIDLLVINGGLNPVARPTFYSRLSPFSETLRKEKDQGRIYSEKPPKDLKIKTSFGLKEEGYFWNRMALLQWTALPERFSFAYDQNVDRLEPCRSFVLKKEALAKGWKKLKKILDLSNVRYLMLFEKREDPALSEIMEYGSRSNYPLTLYMNRSAFPRFYAVPSVNIVKSEEESLQELLSDQFRPEREAIVLARADDTAIFETLRLPERERMESDAGASQKEVQDAVDPPLDDNYKIMIDLVENNRIKLVVDAEKPGYLIVTDSFFPGWKCMVNGTPSKLFQTNYQFRGVPFEKGLNSVELVFRPMVFSLGIVISAIGWIALIAFVIVFRVKRKRVR